MRNKTFKHIPGAPWFDAEYSTLRKLRRHAQKKFASTGLTVHKDTFIKLRKETTNLAKKKKIEYYTNKIEQANEIQRKCTL